MFRFSRGLYARDSSTTFSITVKGCGTRQLWVDWLPVAWGNLWIFTHLEVTIKPCFFHSLFTPKSRVFLIEEWNQSLMLPKKEWSWMHALIWWSILIIFSRWSIVSILSLSHVSHLMMHRAWRHDQSTSFGSTLWKGLGKRALCKGAS